VEIHTN